MIAEITYKGNLFNGPTIGPLLTKNVEVKESYLWWQERQLMYTATGYGARIPTTYMVKVNNRWLRVYCRIYSNSGTFYIESNRKPVATVDIYTT
jgi:hypothetical protein